MSKKINKFIDKHFWGIVIFSIYILICAWWQWKFVMPFIRISDYWSALDMLLGFNPLTPILGWIIYIFLSKTLSLFFGIAEKFKKNDM